MENRFYNTGAFAQENMPLAKIELQHGNDIEDYLNFCICIVMQLVNERSIQIMRPFRCRVDR
jgi:hypothetical protein